MSVALPTPMTMAQIGSSERHKRSCELMNEERDSTPVVVPERSIFTINVLRINVLFPLQKNVTTVQRSRCYNTLLTVFRLVPLCQSFPPCHQPVRSGVEQDVSGSDEL